MLQQILEITFPYRPVFAGIPFLPGPTLPSVSGSVHSPCEYRGTGTWNQFRLDYLAESSLAPAVIRSQQL